MNIRLTLMAVSLIVFAVAPACQYGAVGSEDNDVDRRTGDIALPVRLRNRQRDDGRLIRNRLARRRQRHVVGLQRVAIPGHTRRERRVHEPLDIGHATEAGRQLHTTRAVP